MYTKTITYTDYNGKERTENFYFNLSRMDLLKMNNDYKEAGGLSEAFNNAMNSNEQETAMNIFVDLIIRSYGEKSEDGRTFEKTKEIQEKFQKTEAFNVLFDQLSSDSREATAFFYGIIPQSLRGNNPLGSVNG